MGQTALLPFRRKACWGFFSPWKFQRLRPEFELANLGTKGQHATSRLPKPLSDMVVLLFVYVSIGRFSRILSRCHQWATCSCSLYLVESWSYAGCIYNLLRNVIVSFVRKLLCAVIMYTSHCLLVTCVCGSSILLRSTFIFFSYKTTCMLSGQLSGHF